MATSMGRRGLCLGAALSALLCAVSASAMDTPGDSWRHGIGSGHSLAGKVWDVVNEAWIQPEALSKRLVRARHVLLGEKHDNADHHRLQAWLLGLVASSGRRPAVAFEMLEMEDQPVIDRQLEKASGDAAGLAAAVRWSEKGWPDWDLYEPIFNAAMARGLPIVGANLSRAATRALVAEGLSVLNPELVRDYDLDQPLAPDIHRQLAGELKSSHCGHASPGSIEKMIVVQRVRDAQMARVLVDGGGEDGAILIAGAFHVRKDRGVPSYLAKTGREDSVVSLALVEVSDDTTDPGGYAERFGVDTLPFDYVWFTPRVDDDDPCEKFAEQLRRMSREPRPAR